jgi:xanthine dehydrogenase accessory factor
MRDVVCQLIEAVRAGRPVAYCRLIETRGSTPQKAGALMLVFPDGSQAGTLGGGCVEAEVKRRALTVLQGTTAKVATFQLDSDYGWDDGLICGGRMSILIEPLVSNVTPEYFQRLSALVERGRGFTEAIVFDGQKSGLADTAAYLFDEDNNPIVALHACINDLPEQVAEGLRPLATRPRPYATHGVAYLTMQPRCRLLIVGGGHIGQAVARLAAELEFDIWVVDDREEFTSAERFPRAERRITDDIDRILPELEITPDTYCLIVTRGHNHDQRALYHLAQRGARYVGLIGSRRKIKLIFDELLNEGVSAKALARVHAPLGIEIGSQTVAEIAVSICAELVSHRNRDGHVPGRPATVDVQSLGCET